MKKIITLSFAVISFITANAQFILNGEYRPRTEYSHGYKSLAEKDQDASLFTSQRTRLNLLYANELIKTKLSFQDVRVWGNQVQLVANEEKSVSLHEAWAEILFNNKFSLKVGRQELAYDNQRIFGSVGWAQQGRAHDLALLKYSSNFNLHIGVAYNENSNIKDDIYDVASYKALQFLWFNKKNEHYSASFLLLNNGIPTSYYSNTQLIKQETYYNQTIGGRFTYKINKINLALNAYYQMGEITKDVDLEAYNFSLDIAYKYTDNLSTNIGSEILSGNDYDEEKKIKSFFPFFGTNHKFNGFMDYFYVGNHMNNVGLINNYIKLNYKSGKLSTTLHAHHFLSDTKIDNEDDKYLGIELDLVCSYKFNKLVMFSAGYSQMFASDQMEKLKNGDQSETHNWGWLMITIKPEFFIKK